MNIFKTIRDLFADSLSDRPRISRRSRQEFDEFDLVQVPEDDNELNEWLRGLSQDDYDAIIATAQEVANDRHDYRKFVAFTRYLHDKYPNRSIHTNMATARRKVAPLATRFAGYDENQWSEDELDQWIDSLNDHNSKLVDNCVREWKSKGGQDANLAQFLCKVRRAMEQVLAKKEMEQQAATDKEDGVSLLHLWYVWQEEGRKMEQHTYFQNQNREARKRGYN